jgi:hypothetical protein
MVELTRRFFVFGSAAAVAAAALPPALIAVAKIEPAPALHVFKKRMIREVMVAFEAMDGLPLSDFPGRIRLYRGVSADEQQRLWLDRPEMCLLDTQVGLRSTWRWICHPNEGIVSLPQSLVTLDVEAHGARCNVDLVCQDWIDEGPPIEVIERRAFPHSGPPPLPLFLYADNSLEARVARANTENLYDAFFDGEYEEKYDDDYDD